MESLPLGPLPLGVFNYCRGFLTFMEIHRTRVVNRGWHDVGKVKKVIDHNIHLPDPQDQIADVDFRGITSAKIDDFFWKTFRPEVVHAIFTNSASSLTNLDLNYKNLDIPTGVEFPNLVKFTVSETNLGVIRNLLHSMPRLENFSFNVNEDSPALANFPLCRSLRKLRFWSEHDQNWDFTCFLNNLLASYPNIKVLDGNYLDDLARNTHHVLDFNKCPRLEEVSFLAEWNISFINPQAVNLRSIDLWHWPISGPWDSGYGMYKTNADVASFVAPWIRSFPNATVKFVTQERPQSNLGWYQCHVTLGTEELHCSKFMMKNEDGSDLATLFAQTLKIIGNIRPFNFVIDESGNETQHDDWEYSPLSLIQEIKSRQLLEDSPFIQLP